jgi:hypothetical protein
LLQSSELLFAATSKLAPWHCVAASPFSLAPSPVTKQIKQLAQY